MDVATISAYSMLVPFIAACVRFKRLNTNYIPFLLLIVAGFLSELTCELYIDNHRRYEEVLNVYDLLEAIFITWQFKKWDLFKKNENVFWILIGFYLTASSWESIH